VDGNLKKKEKKKEKRNKNSDKYGSVSDLLSDFPLRFPELRSVRLPRSVKLHDGKPARWKSEMGKHFRARVKINDGERAGRERESRLKMATASIARINP